MRNKETEEGKGKSSSGSHASILQGQTTNDSHSQDTQVIKVIKATTTQPAVEEELELMSQGQELTNEDEPPLSAAKEEVRHLRNVSSAQLFIKSLQNLSVCKAF